MRLRTSCDHHAGWRGVSSALLIAAAAAAAGALPVAAAVQAPESCGCVAQLDALSQATRINYAGYRDKAASSADSAALARHTAALARHTALVRARAARVMGADCQPVLDAYVGFFRDHHLRVRSTPGASWANARGSERPTIPESSLDPVRTDGPEDALLGLWESTSGRTRLRILAAPAPYDQHDRYGVILASADTSLARGDLYATFVLDPDRGVYHATWLLPGRQPQEWSAVVVDDSLLLTGFSGWHRIAADRAGGRARPDPLRPSYRSLAPGAALLTLPSMQVRYAAAVDSLVRHHGDELDRLDLLIIDVRGNQGGGDGTYVPLLPLLYTDTMVTAAGSVLSSPGNIAYYERFLDPEGVNSPAWVVEMLEDMRARPGSQIPLPPARLAYDRVRPRPRSVAILMDAVGASSTETFLLKAVQSSKVRLFGQSTAGIVDYLNPAHHDLGCGVSLQSPTIRRSLGLPVGGVDNRGIAPHVLLPWDARDPVSDILGSYGPMER